MPRKKSLPLGWRDRSPMRLEDTGFYPAKVVTGIAKRFGIKGKEEIHGLNERLETAGTMYLAWKHTKQGPKPRDQRRYFQTIIDQSRELLSLIEGMDDKSYQTFWKTEYQLHQDTHNKKDTRMEDIGVFRWGNDADPEGTIAVYTDFHSIVPQIKYMELLATESLKNVKPGERGREKNKALYWWVSEMARYWEVKLGREFTVSDYKNVPTSLSGQFFEACLAPMDMSALRYLYSQMRQVKADRNN